LDWTGLDYDCMGLDLIRLDSIDLMNLIELGVVTVYGAIAAVRHAVRRCRSIPLQCDRFVLNSCLSIGQSCLAVCEPYES